MKPSLEREKITDWKCAVRGFISGAAFAFGVFSAAEVFFRVLGFVFGLLILIDTAVDERYGYHVATAGIMFCVGLIVEVVLLLAKVDFAIMVPIAVLIILTVYRKIVRAWRQRRV